MTSTARALNEEQQAKAEEPKRGHPLNPNTVIEPVMVHAKDMFDNKPIAVPQYDTYFDWSEPMTEALRQVVALNEAILHRDPAAAAAHFTGLQANIQHIGDYLCIREVLAGDLTTLEAKRAAAAVQDETLLRLNHKHAEAHHGQHHKAEHKGEAHDGA